MGPLEQAYTIQAIGTWPYEKYQITPLATEIDPTLGNLTFENNFPYYNNVGNTFKGYIGYDFGNINISDKDNTLKYQMNLNLGDSFNFSVSTTRKYFDGYIYNTFLIEFDPNGYQKSYVLYPTRLFLKPLSLQKTLNGWRLQTSAILLSATPYYFESYASDISATLINKRYYSTYSDKIELPIIPVSSISLSHQICASQQLNDREVFKFTDTFNPFQYNINLEDAGTIIKPDSTDIHYNVNFLDPNNRITNIKQAPVYNLDDVSFKSYILNYYPDTDPNTQTFMLIQSSLNTNMAFDTINNCVLTAVLNLSTTNFKYFAATKSSGPLSFTSIFTGIPDSIIGLKYITDSIRLKNTKENVYDTVLAYNSDPTKSTMFASKNSDQTGFDTVTWDLKYPPHYYNFNLIFRDSSYYNTGSQESYISFKLSAHPISLTTDTVILSTYIYSDFQLLKLDLPTYGINDYIKFDITTHVDLFLSALCCYYGDSQTPYYAVDPIWIPAVSANLFKITYPRLNYGQIDLSIFPKLSTFAGYIEPYFSTDITLNRNAQPTGKLGTSIFQNLITETQDYIESTVSLLTAETSYPYRDLRNSYISWFWTPSDQHTVLYSLSGTDGVPMVSSIYAGQRVLFSPETSTIALSGYGPNTIVLSVSSEKYNETASLSTNPTLFDIFLEKRFIIGSYAGLHNQNFTRSITLTAAVPYKDRVYPLPNNYPIFWTWQYNSGLSNIPVSAYAQGSKYDQVSLGISNTLSSLDILVETPTTNLGEVLQNVEVYFYSNTDSIQGYYQFFVDNFPDESVLDVNFYTYYQNLTSISIGSTYDSSVLTRPLNNTSKYFFKANDNLLAYTKNTLLVWNITDSMTALSSLSGFSSMFYNISSARTTQITLSALNSIANGWISSHNVSKTLTIYSLLTAEFEQPLSFIIYPEFYWVSGRNLNISDISNYTNAIAPTAYQHVTSDTYNFWVSANKSINFDDYIYSVGKPQVSSVALLNIPYDSRFISDAGLPISLTAYGKEFPATNGLFYQISSTSGLTTKAFNITAQSIPFNTPSLLVYKPFFRAPQLVPYNSSVFTFSATLTDINVDTNRYIYIKQNIYSDPVNSPDQPNGGTVAYTLSSAYWTSTTTVNAIDGEYKLFALSIGDSFTPLTISDKESNTMYLTASASINKTIPKTTFDNYPAYPYTKNLWDVVASSVISDKIETLVTYTTSGRIGLYISEYYALTGSDISIGADRRYHGPDNDLLYYNVNYGDGAYDTFYLDEYVNHSYSSEGSYTVTLSSVYQSGEIRVVASIKPIVIYNEWPKYDQSEIRFLNEVSLVLPYTIDQINIQPNEFGNVDIFNTAVSRLQQNLDYILSNSRTINTDSPTDIYGWLGTNAYLKSSGISWHTADYNSAYYNNPNLAISEGSNYFTDIRSFSEVGGNLVVLDGNYIRYFSNGKIPKEYIFSNYEEFLKDFTDINYIDTNTVGDVVFVTDTFSNKIHRVELDISDISYIFNILDIGGFGSKDDPNKFNSPSKVVYKDSYVYVLDYNNHCIKKYTEQLTWVYTYYSDVLETYHIENFDVHGDTGFVYALTSDYNLHVFDGENSEPFSTLYVGGLVDTSTVLDLRFDESGEFFYILTESQVYKFSSSGTYIGIVNIYSDMKQIKNGSNRTIITSAKNYLLKSNDVVEMFGIGDGLSKTGWTITDIELSQNEFAYDVNYNRSLQRLVDNIKKFRNTIDSKFVLATESTKAGSVTYFAKQPVKISDRPIFSDDIENNNVKVGINELHIPQTFNREFSKIYNALETLKAFLDIKTVNASTSNSCQGVFCWSWKAMSCYNLSLPVIKLCNINPITFAELKSSFGVNYAPTKTWGEAVSTCCESTKSPLL